MENLAFHGSLRWKIIILLILTTSLLHFSLIGKGNVLFGLGSGRANASDMVCTTAARSPYHCIFFARGTPSLFRGLYPVICLVIFTVSAQGVWFICVSLSLHAPVRCCVGFHRWAKSWIVRDGWQRWPGTPDRGHGYYCTGGRSRASLVRVRTVQICAWIEPGRKNVSDSVNTRAWIAE